MWCDLNSPTNHACQQSFSEQNSSCYHWWSSPNPIRWISNHLHHICLKLPRTATFISGKFCTRHSVTLIQNLKDHKLLRLQLLQLFSKKYSQLPQLFFYDYDQIFQMCLISAAMMSWVGCLLTDSELFILFEENSQVLVKISFIPILFKEWPKKPKSFQF